MIFNIDNMIINLFKGIDAEQWKPVIGFPDYEVSNMGQVRSFKSGKAKILKQQLNNSGYPQVRLYKDGRQYWCLVHRLVAEAFLEKPGCKYEINHINGIKTDNRVENLEWVLHVENMSHAVETGLLNVKGEKNPCAKLTENQALEILDMLNAGMPIREIADIFNVSYDIVWNIKTGRSWKHLRNRSPERLDSENPDESTSISLNLNININREAI